MQIKTFVVGFDEKKITSYKFTLGNKVFMFDCGSITMKETDLSDVDYLFISHEHLDHWYGLYKFILKFNKDIKIYATETTKKIMIEVVKRELLLEESNSQKSKAVIRFFEKIISLLFMKEYHLENNCFVTLYPSGHTFGSAMIYLKTPNKNILYTGDMDYVVKKDNRKYYCPNDLEVDVLIIDGTNFLGADYKTQKVNRTAENVKDINHITFNIRTEKAVFLAQHLSEINCLSEHTIIYEDDLKWYLKIISEQGYNAFLNNKIVLESKSNSYKEIEGKTIRLSSVKYNNYNRDWSFSLHISKDDVVSFAHQFTSLPQVFLGHYDLGKYSLYEETSAEYGFTLLKEGVNSI